MLILLCLSWQGLSIDCPKTTYPTGDVCSACSPNCYDCGFYNLACDKCSLAYQLVGQECQKCSVKDCTTCESCAFNQNDISDCNNCCVSNGGCVPVSYSCSTGEYLQNYMCKACQNYCVDCVSAIVCKRCQQTLFLKNGDCVSQCDQFTDYQQNNNCLPCAIGCKGCIGPTFKNCLSCAYGYFLLQSLQCMICGLIIVYDRQPQECVATCPDSYVNLNGYCLSCKNKYCKTCQKNYVCITCIQGAYKNVLKICTACKQTNCKVCNQTTCSECLVDFYLKTNSCVNQCPEKTFKDRITGSCKACQQFCPPSQYQIIIDDTIRLAQHFIVRVSLDWTMPVYFRKNINSTLFVVLVEIDNRNYTLTPFKTFYQSRISAFIIDSLIPDTVKRMLLSSFEVRPYLIISSKFFPQKYELVDKYDSLGTFTFKSNQLLISGGNRMFFAGISLGVLSLLLSLISVLIFKQTDRMLQDLDSIILAQFFLISGTNYQSLKFFQGLMVTYLNFISLKFFDQSNTFGNFYLINKPNQFIELSLVPLLTLVLVTGILLISYKIYKQKLSNYFGIFLQTYFLSSPLSNFTESNYLLSFLQFLITVSIQALTFICTACIYINHIQSSSVQMVNLVISVCTLALLFMITIIAQIKSKQGPKGLGLLSLATRTGEGLFISFTFQFQNLYIKLSCLCFRFLIFLIQIKRNNFQLKLFGIRLLYFILLATTFTLMVVSQQLIYWVVTTSYLLLGIKLAQFYFQLKAQIQQKAKEKIKQKQQRQVQQTVQQIKQQIYMINFGDS